MKRLLAILLAAAMVTTVAMASATYNSGEKYAPGTVIIIESSDFPGDTEALNTDNYSLRGVTYKAGKAYVDSVELTDDDEDDELIITLKKNSSMDKFKDVEFTVKLRGRTNRIDDTEQTFDFRVGYDVNEVRIEEDGYIDENALKPGAINKFVSGSKNWPYGTLEFSPINDVDVSVRVFEDEEIFYDIDEDNNRTVLKNNIDLGVDISFLNFNGMEFERNATVYFYWPDEDGYIYEISSSGKLTRSSAKWDSRESCWVLKTNKLGAFAFSEEKLKATGTAASTDQEEESTSTSSSYRPGDYVPNPSTGGDDLAAVAGALGLTALVAAGSFSLRRKK